MKAAELRKLDDKQLNDELYSSLKEQYNLRMQKSSGEVAKPHLQKTVRKTIARIKTLMNERKGESND